MATNNNHASNDSKKKNDGAQDADNAPEFGIQRIYIKDLSFEAPNTPNVFLEPWRPEVNMDLMTKATTLETKDHEVVLTVTVTVKREDKTIFLAEVQQAGIFSVKNMPESQMGPLLGSFCPNILYPYAREVITDLAMRGGFPQLYLTPVNFDALYEQHQKSQSGASTQ